MLLSALLTEHFWQDGAKEHEGNLKGRSANLARRLPTHLTPSPTPWDPNSDTSLVHPGELRPPAFDLKSQLVTQPLWVFFPCFCCQAGRRARGEPAKPPKKMRETKNDVWTWARKFLFLLLFFFYFVLALASISIHFTAVVVCKLPATN